MRLFWWYKVLPGGYEGSQMGHRWGHNIPASGRGRLRRVKCYRWKILSFTYLAYAEKKAGEYAGFGSISGRVHVEAS